MGPVAALTSAFIFFMAPLNLMYHASTLIDPFAVLTSVIATHSFLCFILQDKRPGLPVIVGFLLATVLTVLIKPLYLFPLALILILDFIKVAVESKTTAKWLEKVSERLVFWIPITIAGVVVLIVWLTVSAKYSTAQDVASHLGWKVLTTPSFYITIAFRYLFYIQTPVTLFLALIAVISCLGSKKIHAYILVLFFALPYSYYFTFANINRPHDYYSLILVPFVAIVAGAGLQQLLNWTEEKFSRKTIFLLIPLMVILFISNCYFYFTNYWLSPNLTNRYEEFASKSKNILQPYEYSLVLVDRNGPFAINEYIAESRRDVVAAVLGKLDKNRVKTMVRPIYGPAVLYSLNHQYGEMIWYSGNIEKSTIEKAIKTYDGNLNYVVVLMASEPSKMKSELNWIPLKAEEENMLVFEIPDV